MLGLGAVIARSVENSIMPPLLPGDPWVTLEYCPDKGYPGGELDVLVAMEVVLMVTVAVKVDVWVPSTWDVPCSP
jgi:hypothetical protein